MGPSHWPLLVFLPLLLLSPPPLSASDPIHDQRRATIDVEGGPSSVVWVVQLSDLHFSVHHPERALDFTNLIGPSLSFINPSLVLITGDLTDGKSKDLLTMKQNEDEWIEYRNVMLDVIKESGLDPKIFYDLRGNHDRFGVPQAGGEFDFYRKYSSNAYAARSGSVYSVTLKSNGWKHLFVGFDSSMDVGLRGPTNVFGHPSEKILTDLNVELSQWDSELSELPATKIAFGHFPLSFSARSEKGRSLKDIFLKHSMSAYVCGHLHSTFGKNLKRNHRTSNHFPYSGYFYQLNLHQGITPSVNGENGCSKASESVKEFWEWEMGDWRKSRAMRILAIDSGHVSFFDTDLRSGIKKTIILPTFPLDSRFMQRESFNHDYECQSLNTSSYGTVRALIFSKIDIYLVYVKIYDTKPGHLNLVMETSMTKRSQNGTRRGELYEAPWNWKAFVDSSADRYWIQIEAVDIMGDSTLSELRPFSINGLVAKVNWTWTEFRVMGLQWGALFYPVLYISLVILFSMILLPRIFLIFRKNYVYRSSSMYSSGVTGAVYYLISWFCIILLEFSKLTFVWSTFLAYSMFLTFFPWFSGNVFTKTGQVGHMTLKGWLITSPNSASAQSYEGVPDILVVVIPHICFVLLPALLAMSALSAEQVAYRSHTISSSKRKEDNSLVHKKQRVLHECGSRWMRFILMLTCLAILWKHWKQCRALVKAYEMNPFTNSPIFCFTLPVLLLYTLYITGASPKS